MSSSFTDTFDQLGSDSPVAPTQPFDDGYVGYDPSQSFSNFTESDSVKDSAEDGSSPTPIYVSGGGFGSDPAELSPEVNGELFVDDFDATNGPILPPPAEMLPEEGYALREWRRLNAIRLEDKEKKEKELLSEIIDEADQFKVDFYKKREVNCETNKSQNRETEKVFLASHEKFHAEADKNFWKSIAELIPNEVPKIEKKGKKDQEKKPSLVVLQGPKPGRPTDLSRMRHILVKLKHNTPTHLKHSPLPAPATTNETKSESGEAIVPKATPVTITPQPVAVAGL